MVWLCETHTQLKKGKIKAFWGHSLETFNPTGLNEKEEYLY